MCRLWANRMERKCADIAGISDHDRFGGGAVYA